MAASAIVPTNETDPTGTKRSVAGASNDFERRLNATYKAINKIIKELDYELVTVNSRFIVMNQLNVNVRYKYDFKNDIVEKIFIKRNLVSNEAIYDYKLSAFESGRIKNTIEDIIARLFMVDADGNPVTENTARRLWFMDGYVEPQYIRGTNQAYTNLSLQSEVYSGAVKSVSQILFTPQYQTRIDFVAAREFELMQGFTSDVIGETRRVLGDGIALGKSPREISKELKSRINVSKSRADRIAATEIPNALRRANVAEGQQASIDFNLKTGYLWMSAFKETSRKTHIARSGHIHSAKEDEEFYSKNGNRIWCYCNQILTVLGDDGKPLSTLAQDKVKDIKAKFLGED